MKRYLFLSLIWVSLTMLSVIETSWTESGLLMDGRTDLYYTGKPMTEDELSAVICLNPGLCFAASAPAGEHLVDREYPAEILAVTGNYYGFNPVSIVRGDFNPENAVLLREDFAYELFNSSDIVGSRLYIDEEVRTVAGIFRSGKLTASLSAEEPELIMSINDPLLNIQGIQLFQYRRDSSGDGNPVTGIPDYRESDKLEINRACSRLRRITAFLQLPVAVLAFIYPAGFLGGELLRRKKLFGVYIRKYYLIDSLSAVLKNKPLLYISPVIMIAALVLTAGSDPYILPEPLPFPGILESVKAPLRFIMSVSDNIHPAVILPRLYNASVFTTIVLLYIPGITGAMMIKNYRLEDLLVLPVLNLAFSLLTVFNGITPVFDLRLNLLLLFLVAYSCSINLLKNGSSDNSLK